MVLLQVRLLFQFFIFFFPNKKRFPLWQPLSLNGKWLSSTIAPDCRTIKKGLSCSTPFTFSWLLNYSAFFCCFLLFLSFSVDLTSSISTLQHSFTGLQNNFLSPHLFSHIPITSYKEIFEE